MSSLKYHFAEQRPTAWNQWPEITWRDPKAPGHMGDISHTWIAAWIPDAWPKVEGGVVVQGLPTWYRTLDYIMVRDASGSLHLHLSGDLKMPPGKIVIQPPGDRPLREVLVNGRSIRSFTPSLATIEVFPAEVLGLTLK